MEMLINDTIIYGALGAYGVILLVAGYFGMQWYDYKYKYPECAITKEAYEKKLSIIEVIDTTNTRHTFLAKKPKDSYKFETTTGLQVDPNLLTAVETPEHHPRGQSVFRYAAEYYAPVGINGTRAIKQLRDKIRENTKFDNVVDDLFMISCFFVSDDKLRKDCDIAVERYELDQDEDGITANELYEEIQNMKPAINKMQLKPGFVNFRDAYNTLPVNFTSSDVNTLEQIVTNITSMSKADEALKWAWVVCLAGAPIALVIVGYLVIVVAGEI